MYPADLLARQHLTKIPSYRIACETIWEISDPLWPRIEPILLEDAPRPPKSHGRRSRIDWRAAFNGIICRLRSGCQWNQLPKQFGDDSSVHRWFQRWCRNGIFETIWAVLVEECDEFGAVHRKWQAGDAMLGKARFGGEKDGQEPDRPGQTGHPKEPAGRRRRRPAGRDDRRSECGRSEAVGGNDRGHR
ncbi:MAG TPA: transposase, partial [Isosphaeraceae bacterium]|nr:transposase [Isosphaeraceae bacterium]